MSLFAPAWLWLSALGLVLLLLHMRRPRTLEIPSIQLWLRLETGRSARRSARWPPLSLLLLLQIVVVLLCALALAGPFIGRAPHYTHEIVVLDGSGSMRMTDVAPSRFDAAVADLARLAAGPIKNTQARMTAILVGARPRLVAARLADPETVVPRLTHLRAGDGATDWDHV